MLSKQMNKKTLQKLLSFAIATVNTANAISPIAIPYANMLRETNFDYREIVVSREHIVQKGVQTLDNIFFTTAEAAYSPKVPSGRTGVVYDELVTGGSQTIGSGGTAINTTVSFGGQDVSTYGLADKTVVQKSGHQTVYYDASATNTILNSAGYQSLYGFAANTFINSGAAQYVYTGGNAEQSIIESGGSQYVEGTAYDTVINSTGIQEVFAGGSAISTTINSGGRVSVNYSGIAKDVNQLDGGQIVATVSGGDVDTNISGSNVNGEFSLVNGIASNFILYQGGALTVDIGGSAVNTVISSGGLQTVSVGGTVTNTSQLVGGNIDAYVTADNITFIGGTNESGGFSLANGTATNFIVYDGGSLSVADGGSAVNTTVKGGKHIVGKGGTSLNVIQTNGNIDVNIGETVNNMVTGINENGAFSLVNGTASNFVINSGGEHVVLDGGSAVGTVIKSAGALTVSSGGVANNLQQLDGARVYLQVRGSDTSTAVNGTNISGAFSLSNGTANNIVLANSAVMLIANGGAALDTTIQSNGVIMMMYGGGTALNTVMHEGGTIVGFSVGAGDTSTLITGTNVSGAFSIGNGIVSNYIVYEGIMQVGVDQIANGGTALNTTISSGGYFAVGSGGSAEQTILSNGGRLILRDGVTITNLTIEEGGRILGPVVGDQSSQTIITGTNMSGAFSQINNIASNFILYEYAYQNVVSGGSAVATIVSSGGSQAVQSGGTAFSTIISSGGLQQIISGYKQTTQVFDTVIESGGMQRVGRDTYANDTVVNGGLQLLYGSASNTTVNQAGEQLVFSYGVAIDNTINKGAGQWINELGSAGNTTINDGGQQYVRSSGITSDTTINSGGYSMVYEGGKALGTTVNEGTLNLSEYNQAGLVLTGTGGLVQVADTGSTLLVGRSIEIKDLSGSQTFVVNADLRNNNADLINIVDSAAGTHYIKINREATKASMLDTLTGYKAQVVATPGGDAIFTGTLSAIDGINIMPILEQDGNNWYIASYERRGDSNLAKVATATANMGYGIYFVGENDTMRQRMGELRDNTHNAGVWAKFGGGEYSIDNSKATYTTFQAGYDKVNVVKNGKTVTGVMAEYLNASNDYEHGSGKSGNTRLGLYHLWLGDSGHYYDVVLKTGKLHNEFSAYDPEAIKGSYNTWNTSISGEYGYRKNLNNGHYITPMAKLTVGRINGASYITDTGTDIRQDGISSVLGRVGISIGRKINTTSWYTNASIVHEFSANSKVTTGRDHFAATIENNLRGTELELAIGGTAKISESGMLYADIIKSFGGQIKNKWKVQGGYRFNF